MHYLETLRFAPDGKNGNWRDTYWEAFAGTLQPLMSNWGFELVGTWQTPIGGGNGNEFTVLWSVADDASWAAYTRATSGLSSDSALRRWREVATRYVEQSFGRLLLESPGHQVTILGRHAAGEDTGVVHRDRPWLYEMEFTEFRADGRDGHWREDYWPEFRERLYPTLVRLGVDLVGAWETAPGSGLADECVFLYRTHDFASWQGFIDSIGGSTKDPVLRARRGEMWVWREQWYSKMMIPSAGHAGSSLRRELE
jgi:hypothetical protein